MEPNSPDPKPDPTFTPVSDSDLPDNQPPDLTPYTPAPLPSPATPVIAPLPDNNPPISPPSGQVVSGDFGSLPAPAPLPQLPPSPMPDSTPGQVVSGGFDPTATVRPSAYASPPTPPQPPLGTPGMPMGSAPMGPAGPIVGAPDPLAPAAATPPPRWRSMKSLVIALAAVLVIGGGSAAAYYGVVAPNQPANVLKTAFINSVQQTQVSTSGSFEDTPVSGSGIAAKGTFSTASDSAAKTVDIQLNLTVSGVNFAVEGRLVNQNLYIRLGDLSTISGLVNGFYPSAGSLIQSLNGDLSNKWIVVDSTLLDEDAGLKCVLNTSWTFNAADIKLLENQYGKNPFTTIQSASNDTIAGKPAEKFVLNVNDDKGAAYLNGLSGLSVVKNLQKCPGSSTTSKYTTNSSLADHDTTPLTIWVDKSTKRVVQISAHSTSQDAKKLNIAGSVTVTLHYGKVSVAAPANAEPALQVLTDIENSAKADPNLLNLMSGGSTSSSSDSTSLTQ